jgi:hypothetical protein
MVVTRSRLPDPHQPAPNRAILSGAGHSSRPFLARDVPDPSFPGSAAWPGDSGSSLLPSGGAHGVVTLRRFAPDRRVDARVPHKIFRRFPRPFSRPRLRGTTIRDATTTGIPADPTAERSTRFSIARLPLRTPVAHSSDRDVRFSEHLCSSGPTCLLIDRVRAPIFFVGVIASPVGKRETDLKGDRSGRSSSRSGFWASFPRSVRVVDSR